MRMVITTGDLEEGAHHVSEETYKKVMLLIMTETHPELSRPTKRAADGLMGAAFKVVRRNRQPLTLGGQMSQADKIHKHTWKKSQRKHGRKPRFFVVCDCGKQSQAVLRGDYLHVFNTQRKPTGRRVRSFRLTDEQYLKIKSMLGDGIL